MENDIGANKGKRHLIVHPFARSATLKNYITSDGWLKWVGFTLKNVEHYLNQIRQFEKEFNPIVSTKVANLDAWFRREKSISETQDKLNEIINVLNETITSGYNDIENIKDDQDLFLNNPLTFKSNTTAVYKLGKSKIS